MRKLIERKKTTIINKLVKENAEQDVDVEVGAGVECCGGENETVALRDDCDCDDQLLDIVSYVSYISCYYSHSIHSRKNVYDATLRGRR